MFFGCNKLKIIDISFMKIDNLVNFTSVFQNCISLEAIKMPKNIIKVLKINGLFANCYKLTSIDISNFNIEKVKDMSHMFYNCQSLISVNFPNNKLDNLLETSQMFHSCISLTSIDFSCFDTLNVIGCAYMFYDCRNLTFIDISSFRIAPSVKSDSIFLLFGKNMSNYGTIRINKEFYNRTDYDCIKNWTIIFN